MEDLGVYLANYSNAECMWWGYQQGCEYVLWRCGVGTNDHSAPADSVARCGGPDWWEDAPQQKAYLASKCVDGIDPCSNANTDRYTTVPSLHCNAQCFYNGGASRTDCALAPAGPVGGNSAGKLWGIALEEHYLQVHRDVEGTAAPSPTVPARPREAMTARN